MNRRIPDLRWYASCLSFCQLPPLMRRHVERRQRALWWKVGKLPRDVGEALDRRVAPLRVFRAVAWAKSADEKRARHTMAIEHHARTGHWPSARVITEARAPVPLAA